MRWTLQTWIIGVLLCAALQLVIVRAAPWQRQLSLQTQSAGTASISGNVVLAAQADTVKVIDVAAGFATFGFRAQGGDICCAALSEDGREVALVTDTHLELWSSAGRLLTTKVLPYGTHYATSLRISRDGAYYAIRHLDSSISVQDISVENMDVVNEQERYLGRHVPPQYYFCTFSPVGGRALLLSPHGVLEIWDFAARSRCSVIHAPKAYNTFALAEFAHQGHMVAVGDETGSFTLLDVDGGTPPIVCRATDGQTAHVGCISTITFSPDDALVATGSEDPPPEPNANPTDNVVRIWDVRTGQCMMVLRGHCGNILAASFEKDGKRFVTGSTDGTVRIWDRRNGDCLYSIRVNGNGNIQARFLSESTSLALVHSDGLEVWQRRRPEQWWGIAWLWEFWMTVVFGGLLVWSIVRDQRYFRKLREAKQAASGSDPSERTTGTDAPSSAPASGEPM